MLILNLFHMPKHRHCDFLHMNYNNKAGVDVPEAFEVCEETVVLTHEEHKPIELPPGKYIVKIVREFDHIAGRSRYVAD